MTKYTFFLNLSKKTGQVEQLGCKVVSDIKWITLARAGWLDVNKFFNFHIPPQELQCELPLSAADRVVVVVVMVGGS